MVDLQCHVSFRYATQCISTYIHTYLCMSVYTHIYILFQILSLIGYYKILSRVPHAVQQALVAYLFYTQQYVYMNLDLLIYPSPLPFPFGNNYFVMSVGLFLFYKKVHMYLFNSTYKQYYIIFVFLCLTSLNLQVHPCCCKQHYFIPFYG